MSVSTHAWISPCIQERTYYYDRIICSNLLPFKYICFCVNCKFYVCVWSSKRSLDKGKLWYALHTNLNLQRRIKILRYDNNARGIKYPNLGSYNYDPCAISFFLKWISFIMSMHKVCMCLIDRNLKAIMVSFQINIIKYDSMLSKRKYWGLKRSILKIHCKYKIQSQC